MLGTSGFKHFAKNCVLFGRPLETTSEERLAEVSLEKKVKNCLKPLVLSTLLERGVIWTPLFEHLRRWVRKQLFGAESLNC